MSSGNTEKFEFSHTYQELVDTCLGNAKRYFNQEFVGKMLVYTYEFQGYDLSKANINYCFNSNIIGVDVLGISKEYGSFVLCILMKFDEGNLVVELFFKRGFRNALDMFIKNTVSIADFDVSNTYGGRRMKISKMYTIESFETRSKDIIIYGKDICSQAEKFYRFESLIAHKCIFAIDEQKKSIDCQYYYNNTNTTHILRGINNYFEIDDPTIRISANIESYTESSELTDLTLHNICKELLLWFTHISQMFDSVIITRRIIDISRKTYELNDKFKICLSADEFERKMLANYLSYEVNAVGNVVDVLNEKLNKSFEEPLPILILRAVVFEHALLLYRKLTQAIK